ncbi:MAG TPA: deoxynucleoside kinase [Candidatus Babeliales bacterium]|nr:deoxynucleoside kinase [Candidatus Babeliales bacterium]
MYIIEGNIGAGKSTFLKLLERHLPYITISLEPLHNWQQQVYGQSLLANFYQEPTRWAYTLETLAMICRVREHMQESTKTKCTIVERSIYSGHYCFAKNGYEQGFLTELEWQVYTGWFNFLIAGKCKPPQGFIYLNIDPAVAFERIKKRNRHAEKKITLKYLKQLHQRHEDFLIHKIDVLSELHEVPVLVLDCNKEFETDKVYFAQLLHDVELFIHRTQLACPKITSATTRRSYDE